jgi:hypothetical protein
MVAARDQSDPAPPFPNRHRRSKEVISFIAWGLVDRETVRVNEYREDVELFEKLIVKIAPVLIPRKFSDRPIRCLKGILVHNDGTRLFILISLSRELAKPTMAPAPLPPARRIVFGSPWEARCAKESLLQSVAPTTEARRQTKRPDWADICRSAFGTKLPTSGQFR